MVNNRGRDSRAHGVQEMNQPGYLGPPIRIDKPGVRNAYGHTKFEVKRVPHGWHAIPGGHPGPIPAPAAHFDKFVLPGYKQQLGCCDDLHGALSDLGACGRELTTVVVEDAAIPQWVWLVAAGWAALMLLKRGGR